MSNFIARMNQRSESKRRMFALVSSGLITMVIFTIWVSTFGSSSSEKMASTETKENIFTPLKTLKQSVASAFSGFQNAVQGGLSEVTKEITNTSQEYEAKTVNTR